MSKLSVACILLFILGLSIIAPQGIPLPFKYASTWGVDKEFQPYVKSFYADAAAYGPPIVPYFNPIVFVKGYDDDIVATCGKIRPFGIIEVSRAYWKKASAADKEIVIYHELGHCILGLGHGDFGIMKPYLLNASVYLLHRDFYMWELFTVETIDLTDR